MRNCTSRVGRALTLLALLGLAVPGRAQQPNQSPPKLVPLKFTAVETGEAFDIPVNPPITAVRLSLTSGQSDLLGPFTGIAHNILHFSADGIPSYFTDGVGVITAANGTDAIFLAWIGVVPPSTTGDVPTDLRVTITGGTGRFLGATGSGVLLDLVHITAGNPPKGVGMWNFVGLITAPKP